MLTIKNGKNLKKNLKKYLKMLYTIFENIIYYHLIRVIKIKYVIENKTDSHQKDALLFKNKSKQT